MNRRPARIKNAKTDGPAQEPRRPAVAVVPWGADAWGVVIQPGSDSAAVQQALGELPAGLELREAFGDVDVVLVYTLPAELASRRDVAVMVGKALGLPRGEPVRSRWMTSGEYQAYQAGYRDALDAVRIYLTEPDGDAGPVNGPTVPDDRAGPT